MVKSDHCATNYYYTETGSCLQSGWQKTVPLHSISSTRHLLAASTTRIKGQNHKQIQHNHKS